MQTADDRAFRGDRREGVPSLRTVMALYSKAALMLLGVAAAAGLGVLLAM